MTIIAILGLVMVCSCFPSDLSSSVVDSRIRTQLSQLLHLLALSLQLPVTASYRFQSGLVLSRMVNPETPLL
jgi:hypothetical protein